MRAVSQVSTMGPRMVFHGRTKVFVPWEIIMQNDIKTFTEWCFCSTFRMSSAHVGHTAGGGVVERGRLWRRSYGSWQCVTTQPINSALQQWTICRKFLDAHKLSLASNWSCACIEMATTTSPTTTLRIKIHGRARETSGRTEEMGKLAGCLP